MSAYRNYHRVLSIVIGLFSLLLTFQPLRATEETEASWPLGPIGGKFRIWTGENFVRVSEITAGAPGAVAGLQVNDMITGAFGRSFDHISGGTFSGVVRQLGAAIDHAELNGVVLPLSILRPGTGKLTLNITLPALGGLDPAYPMTSSKFAAQYETACAALHTRIMAASNGIAYPSGFAGLAMLGHPNWNDTTGAKPYRLSVNKIRDWAVAKINNAVLTPVEAKFFDGAANPAFVNPSLENWELGPAVMFLAEYVTKTGEQATYQATLQRGAVLMANRIQNWAQPFNGGSGDRSYETTRGATSQGGVVGDYTHSFFVGLNITGVHLFNGLALAKRAGVDMMERPKDGHYFGMTLNPGDAIPATIAPALPATIILPRGAQDTRLLPHIDNTTNAPLTTITTVDASNNPWFYDCSLDQKFWLHWDFLARSTHSTGYVGYAVQTIAAYDAGARTPGALLGMLTYQNGAPLSNQDQLLTDSQMAYIIRAHEIHLNAHIYNMGGAVFTALLMPYMSDVNQRYFLDNWKFFHTLSRQPDGSLSYFRGRSFGDTNLNEFNVMNTNVAILGSVARGGLPHYPGFATNRIFARVHQPLLEWPKPEVKKLKLGAGQTSTNFDLDLIDNTGAVVTPTAVNWTVVSGPATSGILSSPASIDTTATFSVPGTYRLQMNASAGALTTQETIDVEVLSAPVSGYVMGEADYKIYSGISGTTVAALTSAPAYPASPSVLSTLTELESLYSSTNFGATITCVVIPPVTGSYTFHIASSKASELWLNSSGPEAAGAAKVASLTTATTLHNWTANPSQGSTSFTLTAGQPYYLQVRHKGNAAGGEHVSVGWTTPLNGSIQVIGASSIASPGGTETPAILTQPANVTTTLGATVNLTFTVAGSAQRFFQWKLNGQNFGNPTTTPTLTLSNSAIGHAGNWQCVYTNGDAVLTTQTATVSFSDVGVLGMGGLWQENYTNITGGAVINLTSSPNFPNFPSSSGVLAEPSTSTMGDNYGQRWSGWLVASVTGNYRFYASSDDLSRLSLSPDQYESHKQTILTVQVPTGEQAWSARPPSVWKPLVAGQRYFVEFLHKEGTGADHAAFTWQREGDPVPADGAGLIPSANLQHITGGTRPDATTAPPVAFADTPTPIIGGATLTFDPLLNDADASLTTVTITAITQPATGTLIILPGARTLAYASNAAGTHTATYTITNSIGLTSTADITFTVAENTLYQQLGGWWRMNEGSGTTTADSSDAGRTATLVGSPAWTTGKLNGGLSFSGTNYLTIPGSASPSTLTISAWVKPTSTTGIQTILSQQDSFSLSTNGTGVRFSTLNVLDYNSPAGLITANVWQHVAASFTPNTTGGLKIYHNGLLVATADTTTINTNTNDWQIGRQNTSQYFGGSLGDVRLHTRILSSEEISQTMGTTPFDDWRANFYTPAQLINATISGPLADPDHDGIDNIMEYAIGLDPNTSDQLSSKITADFQTVGIEKYRRLTITKNPAATDVTYTVQVSSDLKTWSTTATEVVTNTASTLSVRDTTPMSSGQHRFIRLLVNN